MRYAIAALVSSCFLAAGSYKARIEPVQRYTFKAAVAGSIVQADEAMEGKYIDHQRIVHIDDDVERMELHATRRQIQNLEETIRINADIVPLLEENAARQKAYYQRLRKLSTASQTQKDNAFNAYVSAQSQYSAMQEKILTLKRQLHDLRVKQKRLEDSIDKKSLVVQGYLYKLAVRKGDYVAPGTLLAVVHDTSKAKLVLFVPAKELDGIDNKQLFINGLKVDYQTKKVWRVPDETYLSSYRVELIVDAPKAEFGTLVDVVLK